MTLAIVALVFSCLGYGAAAVIQAVGSRRATGLVAVIQPLYLLGVVINFAAFAASYLAIERLPLFLVNAVLAGSIAITVILARVFLGTSMGWRDILAIGAVIAGIVLLAIAAGGEDPVPPRYLLLSTAIGALVLVLVLVALWRSGPAWALATVSGLGFGLISVAARTIDGDSIGAFLHGWVGVLTMAVGGIVASLACMRGFQRGHIGLVVVLQNGTSVVMAAVIGLVFLGDTVAAGFGWALVAGLLAVLVGCSVLAMSPAMKAVS